MTPMFHALPVHWGAEAEGTFDGTAVTYDEEHLPRRLAELAAAQPADEVLVAVGDGGDIWDAGSGEVRERISRPPARELHLVLRRLDEHARERNRATPPIGRSR